MLDDDPIGQNVEASDDPIGEHAERRQERRYTRDKQLMKVADAKLTIAQAEDAGLADDPVIAELRDRVDAVEAELGFTPDAGEQLVDEHGLDEGALARIPEDKHAELLDLLERAEARAGDSGSLARREARNLQEKIKTFGQTHNVAPTNLAPQIEGLRSSLAAELSESTDNPAELSAGMSERQKEATLRDRREDLVEEVEEAPDLFARLRAQDRLEAVEAKLQGDDGDGETSDLSAALDDRGN